MKNISFVALLSLFILAACTSTPDTSNVGSSDDSGPLVRGIYASDLDCDMLDGAETRENCKMQVNDVIGALLENDVISHFDLERCIALQDKIGSNCQTQLKATDVEGPVTDDEIALFSQAVNGMPAPESEDGSLSLEFDAAKCDKLTASGYKEYCHKEITQRIELALFNDITLSGDLEKCSELTTLQTQCEEFFNGPPEFPL